MLRRERRGGSSCGLSPGTVSVPRTGDGLTGGCRCVGGTDMYGLLEWGDLDDACTPPEPVREGAAMACEFAAGGRAPAESDSGSGADGEEEEAEGLKAGCIRITNASAAAEADFDALSAFRSLGMACEGYIGI